MTSAAEHELSAINSQLDAMRENGANRFDPVRFRFLESMANQCEHQRKAVANALYKKLSKSLAEYEKAFAEAQQEATEVCQRLAKGDSDNADLVKRLFDAHQFKQIELLDKRLQRDQENGLLSELTQRIEQKRDGTLKRDEALLFDEVMRAQETDVLHNYANNTNNQPPIATQANSSGLKSFHLYRDSFLKQNAAKILQQAINSAPENAGPLNSEMLTIRSLVAMRDLSPEYSNRLMSYIDTLLWLEKANNSLEEAKGKGVKKKKRVRKKKSL